MNASKPSTIRTRAAVIKRRRAAILRFQSVVRAVMFNRLWIVDPGEQKYTLDVHKNVTMLVRPHNKIGILTMVEKALIRKQHTFRTIEERKRLVMLIAGLQCFSELPPTVRARLAQVVQFIYCEPGRAIIKEGYMPVHAYYILTGNVEVTKKVYKNGICKEKIEFISGSGDCLDAFGLVHNNPRRYSYTAKNMVELLVVYPDDFEKILFPFYRQQWDYKLLVFENLGYFDFFNEEQVTDACSLGVLRQYKAFEIIYEKDLGRASYTYFMISGECTILQSLKMKVTKTFGKKHYELLEVLADDETTISDYGSSHQNIWQQFKSNTTLVQKETESQDSIEIELDINKQKSFTRIDLTNVEYKCQEYLTATPARNSLPVFKTSQESSLTKINSQSSKINMKTNAESVQYAEINSSETEESAETDQQNKEKEIEVLSLRTSSFRSSHKSSSQITKPEDANFEIENHIINIGNITNGGIFGLGEKFIDRIIISETAVQVLLLPRFWLCEQNQNPGNIWQRRKLMLDSALPTRETLFKDFLTTRKWQTYKNSFMKSIVESVSTQTHVNQIPTMCQIQN